MKKEAYFRMMGLDKKASLQGKDFLNLPTVVGAHAGYLLGDKLYKWLNDNPQDAKKKSTWKREIGRTIYGVSGLGLIATAVALARKKLHEPMELPRLD